MKIIINISIVLVTFLLLTVFPAFSGSCEQGAEIFKHAMKNAPDEMTLEYLNSALEVCTDKSSLYKDAARYYKEWFEKDPNPDKQATYKALAIEFYNKAMESGHAETKVLKEELATLQQAREFNKIAFRALRPSKPGAVNTGLDMYINFERNSHKITGGLSILDELGEIMRENQSVQISLEGHTDSTGTLEYNDDLSLSRASTVKKYIMDKYNIDPSRMQVSGYGYKYPLNKNDPTGPLNRRVEVIKLTD